MASPSETENAVPNEPESRHRRRGFYGHGSTGNVEKNVFSRFLDDAVYAVFDVTLPSMPILWVILLTTPILPFGAKNATFAAWGTMVLGIAAIRGRLISPLGASTVGWPPLSASLVLLRVLYYNVVLAVAGYVGGLIGLALGSMFISSAAAIIIAAIATSVFPVLAERYHYR